MPPSQIINWMMIVWASLSFFPPPPPFFQLDSQQNVILIAPKRDLSLFFTLLSFHNFFCFQFSVCCYYVAKNFEMMALESGSPLSQQQQKIEEMIVRGIKSGNQTTRKFTRPWKCCCYCSLSQTITDVVSIDSWWTYNSNGLLLDVSGLGFVTRMVIQTEKRGAPYLKAVATPPYQLLDIFCCTLSYFFLYVTVWLWCTWGDWYRTHSFAAMMWPQLLLAHRRNCQKWPSIKRAEGLYRRRQRQKV